MFRYTRQLAITSLTLALPASAFAGSPDELAGPMTPQDPAVWGGEEVGLCGWPTVARVQSGSSLCTGTLIHPQIAMFAAHCEPDDNTDITFGEPPLPSRKVDVEYCKKNPNWTGSQFNGWDSPRDFAYCKLDEWVDLPITPAVFGCEENSISNGMQVAVIGFGNDSGDSGSGTKRWANTTIHSLSWNNNTVSVGGTGEPTICSGDSGGPIMVQYNDGAWRALSIASTKSGSTCNSAAGNYALARDAVVWIEQDSGIDVTPCHDLQGNWDPGPYCGGFLTSGAGGGGSYFGWCDESGESGWSTTCGSAFSDLGPPTVSITSPSDGQVFPDAPTTTSIQMSASDDSGVIAFAQIEIDGSLIESHGDGGGTTTGGGESTGGGETTTAGDEGTDTGGEGSSSGEPSTDVGTGAADSGFSSGAFDGGAGDEASGCDCDGGGSAGGLFALGLLGWVRRRRGTPGA
jgi:hypothetical protein